MSAADLQILVVVDLYPAVSVEELTRELPHERAERVVLRLTDPEFGAPRLEPPPDASPVDWHAIGRAVEALAARVRDLRASKPNPVVLYVGGRGPLPVFIHLGYLLPKFTGRQIVLNPAGGGRWEPFEIDAPAAAEALFDAPHGLLEAPVYHMGCVAIHCDTAGRSTPDEVFANALEEEGHALAGLVKIRSTRPLKITPENFSAAAQEITQVLSMAPSRYPRRSAMAVFFAGPAQLAFALGRSLNPTVVGREVWLTNYRDPKYEWVYSLPYDRQAVRAPAIPQSDGDKVERRRILDAIVGAIEDLKKWLKPEHLPPDVLAEHERGRFIERLQQLTHVTEESDSFSMRVVQGRYTLGEGLLETFRRSSEQQRKDFAQLFLLHELLHDWQKVRSTNHFHVGRAGVVLEQIDFAADSFALRAILKMELDLVGPRERARAREILARWLEAVLHGVEAFDLMEQGETIQRLSERRLRRYLAWHLQLARASTVTDASQVDVLLRPALTVELAPLAGYLDAHRHEKIVRRALPETELFCAIDGHLVRQVKRPGFEPGALVGAVRNYKRPVIQAAMIALVDEHRPRLAPWQV